MPPVLARQILEPCLRIDRQAREFYLCLAGAAADPGLAALWRQMAADEARHVEIWSQALRRWADRSVAEVLGKPGRLARDLAVLEFRVAELLAEPPGPDPARAFLVAYRLEFYLLDPGMDVLLLLASGEKGGGVDGEYARHIERLVRGFERYRGGDPMAALAGEMLGQLWSQSRSLAQHLKVLRDLKTLVPICSECKRIRDDAGYWQHVEAYLKTHAGFEFTHGVCPACSRRLYPPHGEEGPESPG